MNGGHAVFELDLDEAQRRVDDWQAALEARAAQARELGGRLADLRAVGEAEKGLVRATVDASGHLVDLSLNSRVTAWSVDRIAAAVVEAAAAARAAAAERARELSVEVGLADATD